MPFLSPGDLPNPGVEPGVLPVMQDTWFNPGVEPGVLHYRQIHYHVRSKEGVATGEGRGWGEQVARDTRDVLFSW